MNIPDHFLLHPGVDVEAGGTTREEKRRSVTETNTGREDGGKEREVVVTEGDRDREKEVKSFQAVFLYVLKMKIKLKPSNLKIYTANKETTSFYPQL